MRQEETAVIPVPTADRVTAEYICPKIRDSIPADEKACSPVPEPEFSAFRKNTETSPCLLLETVETGKGKSRMEQLSGNAFIWDLDGTLLYSYDVITESLADAMREKGLKPDLPQILLKVKRESVMAFSLSGGSAESFMKLYRQKCAERNNRITLTEGAVETLESLKKAGARHFVYTHRGQSTEEILQRLGIESCFEEIVTHENGFAPKPAPDGVLYLMEKYGLDPERTYYVGDRKLDVLCAKNAGIKSILFLEEGSCVEPTGLEDCIVHKLTELAGKESSCGRAP